MFFSKPKSRNVRNATRKAANKRNLQLEALENRKMMTINCSLDAAGTLSVIGDAGVDKVTVYTSGINTAVESISPTGAKTYWNMGSTVKALLIAGYGSDDVITNNTNLPATIYGGNGNDTINGGSNVDKIYGELGNDIINGNAGGDFLYGGGGSDTIRGGAGFDGIMGDDSTHDAMTIAQEAALPYSNADTIYGGADDDQMIGGLGNDVIFGGAGNDQINGGRGDDQLYGDDAMNRIFCPEDNAYAGNDTLDGGDGNDRLAGDAYNDTLYGGSNDDLLIGQDGDDKLYGQAGNDVLYGQFGSDFLDAGSINEFADGGDGLDFNAYVTTVNGAKFDDIAEGTPWAGQLLSAMSSAAAKGIDLGARISYSGLGSYAVSLFDKNSSGSYSPTTVYVKFDGKLTAYDTVAHFRGQEGESWTIIMNRALNQLLGFGRLNAAEALSAITGRAAATYNWTDASGGTAYYTNDYRLQTLYNVGNQIPTVVSTYGAGAVDTRLFSANRTYAVKNVYITGYNYVNYQYVPQYTVVLYNPEGVDNKNVGTVSGAISSGDNNDGLITISGDAFLRNFGSMSFA